MAQERQTSYVAPFMISRDDFQYAVENTHVIMAPRRRIETFGQTSFRFYLVTELMDRVDHVRIRDGTIHAERPQILRPAHLSRLLLEGFGDKAREFVDWMQSHGGRDMAFLKYGFQFRKNDVVENVVHNPIDDVVGNIKSAVNRSDEALSAIIQGVDDAWEVCLLKFTVDMIEQSAGGNLGDFRSHGLL